MSPNRRITLLTYGTRGDVEPFVALGIGLRQAGYTVRLAAPAPFAAFVQANGLEFYPIAGNPADLSQAFSDRAGSNWVRIIARMVEHVLPLARDAFGVLRQAAQGADLIVHSFLMTDAGHTLARLAGIPDVSAQFFPIFLPTAAFPAVALPDLPLGGAYRRASHALNTAVFRYGARLIYHRLRASAPDFPDLAPWLLSRAEAGRTPMLFAYSPHLLPIPPEWPPYAQITGYWQLPLPPGWEPPQDLARFLDSGPPPVYFGPGSARSQSLGRLLQMVVAALRACGQRVLLGVSPQAVSGDLAGADVCAVQGIPHAWLFPRLRYILHHGGAGTTGAAAASGVPGSAIPFSTDQAFWARRIARLGLGPAVPPAQRLTGSLLQAILQEALSNPAYQANASALGEKIRQENGVAAAIQVIQRSLGDNGGV